jgi:probable O-glycosylation ligase (exosortase A-associated)
LSNSINNITNIERHDERPIIEFPGLIKIGIVILSVIIGILPLFLPWYFAILGVFLLGFLIAVFFDPYIGLLAFLVGALLHPVEFFASSLAGLHLSRNLAFGVLLIWIFHTAVYKDFKIIKTKQNFLIVGFGLILLISSLQYFDYSFPAFLEFIKLLVLYFLVVNLVKTRRKLLIMIWGLVVLGTIACFIGIYQHAHGIGVSYGEGFIRIRGTALDPNDYAMHLVVLIPFVMGLIFTSRNYILKLGLISTLGLLIINIIYTYSRGGLVSLIFILGASILWFGFKFKKQLLAIFTLSVGFFVMLPFVPEKYIERAKTVVDLNDPAIIARLDTWKTGLLMMRDEPLRGIGLGVFKYEYASRAFTSGQVETKAALFAHNAYIQIGAETGMIGLLLFILILFFSWVDLKKSERNFQDKGDNVLSCLSLSIRMGLLGYMVSAIFLTQAFLTMLWIILPMAVVMKNFSIEKNVYEENN